jgi:hypothetical protein
METGNMSDPTVNEFEIDPEKLNHVPGFLDPEVRKRAQEKSLAVRRGEVPAKPEPFLPSKNMLTILKIALDLDSGDSVRGWFAKAGLSRDAWFRWQENPEFRAWWKKEFMDGVKEYESKWILIGLKKMSKDFRYWNEIGKKIYGFIDKIAVKEEKSPEEAALYTELLGLIKSYKGMPVIEAGIDRANVIDVQAEVIEGQLLEELSVAEKAAPKEGSN